VTKKTVKCQTTELCYILNFIIAVIIIIIDVVIFIIFSPLSIIRVSLGKNKNFKNSSQSHTTIHNIRNRRGAVRERIM